MMKFQYKTEKNHLDEKQLNKLGLEGWELVSHSAIYVTLKHEIKQHYIFKRQIL